MVFDPFKIQTYNIDELIGFIRTNEIELKDINNLRGINSFSVADLLKLVGSGLVKFEELQQYGLHYIKQQEMKQTLALMEIENKIWQSACSTDTVDAYQNYIDQFPNGQYVEQAKASITGMREKTIWQQALSKGSIEAFKVYLMEYPDGRYSFDAKTRIYEIEEKRSSALSELIEDMRERPWHYTPFKMDVLFRGADEPGNISPIDAETQFLHYGLKLEYNDLIEAGIIPNSITKKDLITSEFFVPQFGNSDSFPLDRTDIYFFGVPRSGKSSVLAGLFNTMYRKGIAEFVPNIGTDGRDRSMEYYNGLIRSISAKKPPVPTAKDTIFFINIDIKKDSKHVNELNFVEINGENFMHIADIFNDGAKKWEEIGASRCLQNNNRKVLFFLLDYNVILGNQEGIAGMDQALALQNALTVFTHDGTGNDRSKNCTMSKVETVAVILTKSDLMNVSSPEERMAKANEYLHENFLAFMNSLTSNCQRFGINAPNGNRPYVITFSLGKFFVGNTMLFDETDSLNLANFISKVAPSKKTGFSFF